MDPTTERELKAVSKIIGMIEESLLFIRTIDPKNEGPRTSGAKAALMSLRREIRKEFCL